MKRLLFITVIFVLVFAWGAAPAKASPLQTFSITKLCDGSVAHTCFIQGVDGELSFLSGASIFYTDHAIFTNEAGMMHEAATILITTTGGDTAVGHVSWVLNLNNGDFSGTVTIQPGTGQLEGFHALADIDALGGGFFSFTGTYFFTP